jgi:hypothetical protein
MWGGSRQGDRAHHTHRNRIVAESFQLASSSSTSPPPRHIPSSTPNSSHTARVAVYQYDPPERLPITSHFAGPPRLSLRTQNPRLERGLCTITVQRLCTVLSSPSLHLLFSFSAHHQNVSIEPLPPRSAGARDAERQSRAHAPRSASGMGKPIPICSRLIRIAGTTSSSRS